MWLQMNANLKDFVWKISHHYYSQYRKIIARPQSRQSLLHWFGFSHWWTQSRQLPSLFHHRKRYVQKLLQDMLGPFVCAFWQELFCSLPQINIISYSHWLFYFSFPCTEFLTSQNHNFFALIASFHVVDSLSMHSILAFAHTNVVKTQYNLLVHHTKKIIPNCSVPSYLHASLWNAPTFHSTMLFHQPSCFLFQYYFQNSHSSMPPALVSWVYRHLCVISSRKI